MTKPQMVELLTLLLRHVKGVASTLEKILEALKEEPDAKAG